MEAVKLLKVRESTIDRLIANGILKATVVLSSKRRLVRIDRKSIKSYLKNRAGHVTVKAVSKILGISEHLAWRLLKAGLIKAASGPGMDGGRYTFIDRRSIAALFEALHRCFFDGNLSAETSSSLVCLHRAQMLLRYFKIGYVDIIKQVLAGLLVPCALSTTPGLDAFLFNTGQVKALAQGRKG